MDSLKEYTFLQLSDMIPATLLVIDLGYVDIIHLDRMINSDLSFLETIRINGFANGIHSYTILL